jgi:hypothetical protein
VVEVDLALLDLCRSLYSCIYSMTYSRRYLRLIANPVASSCIHRFLDSDHYLPRVYPLLSPFLGSRLKPSEIRAKDRLWPDDRNIAIYSYSYSLYSITLPFTCTDHHLYTSFNSLSATLWSRPPSILSHPLGPRLLLSRCRKPMSISRLAPPPSQSLSLLEVKPTPIAMATPLYHLNTPYLPNRPKTYPVV